MRLALEGPQTPLELAETSPGIWSGSLLMPPTPQLTYTLQAVDNRGNVSSLDFQIADASLTESSGLPGSGLVPDLLDPVDALADPRTLDYLYDAEGAGAGRTIQVDGSPVEILGDCRLPFYELLVLS